MILQRDLRLLAYQLVVSGNENSSYGQIKTLKDYGFNVNDVEIYDDLSV